MKPLACALVPLILLSIAQAAPADCCCDHCGCQSTCRKVCRLKCETKKVPKITYDCECEEFCVPGKSECSIECDDCGNKHKVYKPTCGKLRTRTKLVKHETMEEKMVYEWVVEHVCCSCAAKLQPQAAHDAQLAANGAPPSGDFQDVDFERPADEERLSRFDLRRLLIHPTGSR